MDAVTRTAVLLGVAALVVPLVWGYVAYRLLEWAWPQSGRPGAPGARSPRKPPQEHGADFLDFQI